MTDNHIWTGGPDAWRKGLDEKIAALRAEYARATRYEEQQELQSRIKALEQERREAKKHGGKWLH